MILLTLQMIRRPTTMSKRQKALSSLPVFCYPHKLTVTIMFMHDLSTLRGKVNIKISSSCCRKKKKEKETAGYSLCKSVLYQVILCTPLTYPRLGSFPLLVLLPINHPTTQLAFLSLRYNIYLCFLQENSTISIEFCQI